MQIKAGAVKPQIHPTSIPLKVLQGEWVTLSINLPDYDVGEVLFVRLYVDGKLYLYPCANSGSGYEIIAYENNIFCNLSLLVFDHLNIDLIIFSLYHRRYHMIRSSRFNTNTNESIAATIPVKKQKSPMVWGVVLTTPKKHDTGYVSIAYDEISGKYYECE